MSEKWEALIEHELEFYLNFPAFQQDIEDALYENELDIQYPVTRFDSKQGRVYIHCPGTEEQAMRRIERKESLQKLLEHGKKRVHRLFRALHQLTENEREIVLGTIRQEEVTGYQSDNVFGFRTGREFDSKQQAILLKLLDFYQIEREEHHKEFNQTLKEERQKKAAQLRKSRQIKSMNSTLLHY